MKGHRGSTCILILLSILYFSPVAAATTSSQSEEQQRCLECHAKPGIIKVFQNNESVNAFLDPNTFHASIHHALACASCHADFSDGLHPERQFKSLQQYRVKSSLICRRCHADDQISKHAVHDGVLRNEQGGKPLICTNCHGSHGIVRISGKGAFTNEEQYCMKCHGRPITMPFKNGERRSLVVNTLSLKMSAHGKLSCSDCHFGFSSEEHPERMFGTGRDFLLASSESCRRCHFDKYTKTLESIHYTMLSQGRLDAPVCTDCHGSHEVTPVGKERTASAKRCQRCHAREYDRYAKSVHGKALFNDHNQDVPVCADCHTAHTIEDPFSLDYRERIPEMCSNCHGKAEIVGKYGLSTNVIKTYLSDFHGVTLAFYKLQNKGDAKPRKPIAVCTDCHGTHGISSARTSDAAGVKKNLLKRCQKCHPDANAHFPDAWLSHYEPSLRRSPFVFIAGFVYQLFIPLIIIGFVLQILLHIWRYAVNR